MRHVRIPVDGAELSAHVIGDGRPIVVLLGGPDLDDEYLLPDLGALADLGRVVCYAQRGRGRSYAGASVDGIGLESEMADIEGVRRWTGHERVAILGHSFGTLLALEYATRYPDHVSHLALVNPAPASYADRQALRAHFSRIRTTEEQDHMAALRSEPAYVAGSPSMEEAVNAIHFRAFADPANLAIILGRIVRLASAETILAARAIETRLSEETWLQRRYDLIPRLRGLRIPTLVIRCDRDFIPPEIGQHITDAIPGARLVDIDDCGHFALLEQPEAVHRAIADLLDQPPTD